MTHSYVTSGHGSWSPPRDGFIRHCWPTWLIHTWHDVCIRDIRARFVESSKGRFHMSLLANDKEALARQLQTAAPWQGEWETESRPPCTRHVTYELVTSHMNVSCHVWIRLVTMCKRHVTFEWVVWRQLRIAATWEGTLEFMCDNTHTHTHSYGRCDTFIYETWFISLWDMTHSYVIGRVR